MGLKGTRYCLQNLTLHFPSLFKETEKKLIFYKSTNPYDGSIYLFFSFLVSFYKPGTVLGTPFVNLQSIFKTLQKEIKSPHERAEHPKK